MIPHDTHLHIGSLLFEGIDQIDLTGPFEVLARIPNSTYRIYGKTAAPVRDIEGLRLTPDAPLADAPPLDVLHVPGGHGQEALMDDAEVLNWIRQQASGACSIFSVCTGALICGAAGPAQGTPRDDPLGVVSPAALFRRDPRQRARSGRWRLGLCRGRHSRHRRRLAPCASPPSCAATRSHRPSSFIWPTRRNRHSTAVRPRRRRHRSWNRLGDRCGPSRCSASIRHGASRPNSVSPLTSSAPGLVWREPRVYWRARQRLRPQLDHAIDLNRE